MAAYGKDDFVFSFDDYDFSDFSDFSDDCEQHNMAGNISDSEVDEGDFEHCICSGRMTTEMIGCDGETCVVKFNT